MENLVAAKLVASDWNANQYKGMITNSVVTFMVRKGNPLHITNWNDLIKPGVKVVTPNPLSSGSAIWNLMAAYGAQLERATPRRRRWPTSRSCCSTRSRSPSSGADATAAFVGGTGDVLLGTRTRRSRPSRPATRWTTSPRRTRS